MERGDLKHEGGREGGTELDEVNAAEVLLRKRKTESKEGDQRERP